VRDRGAEQRHHGITDELLNRAAVPLNLRAEPRVVRREHRADILRVETLSTTREAHKVGEQHGHDLPLLACRRYNERSSTATAELKALRIFLTAAPASLHGHTLRPPPQISRQA
jgi:hypothetical protein